MKLLWSLACPVFCAIAALISVLLGTEMLNTSPVLSFGDADKNCLRSVGDSTSCKHGAIPTLAPGDPIKMCFGDITWYRIIPSHGKMFFFDKDNMRHDLDDKLEPIASHVVSLPAKVGPIEPKCRISRMPAGVPPGPAVLTGIFTSTDTFLGVTRVVTTSYPRMPFVAKSAQ